jgi:hypothetical protein
MDSNVPIERQRFNLTTTTIGRNGWLSFILCFLDPMTKKEGCVVEFVKPVLCYGEKVLNFLLCIPEGSKVQSQSLAVGCAPLSLHVPFFYRKILSVMIHHWITFVIRMFFPWNFWLDTKENWIFSIKLYLMGRCFLNFLPNTLLVVFNVINLYMHAFDI